MPDAPKAVIAHLLGRLRDVQLRLGWQTGSTRDPSVRFADALDSMGMVEFLAVVAEDCGVTPAAIEECVGRTFGTVAELAAGLHAAGLAPGGTIPKRASTTEAIAATAAPPTTSPATWLAATAIQLPGQVQPAGAMNEVLHRPPGWLEQHAGIEQRGLWAEQDTIAAAADAARDCLGQAGLGTGRVGALLVTSEAPPILVGLAAALHHRLSLNPHAISLEIGGACAAFLSALSVAQMLIPRVHAVLVVSVEAPSRYLQIRPGPAGENAALFGDGAAAALLCSKPAAGTPLRLVDVLLGVNGQAGDLLRVERTTPGPVELQMQGIALGGRAVRTMARSVAELANRHDLAVSDLAAVVAHGGNGRLPGLLARQLGLPAERVWSETPRTGNLGSASLPVAWNVHSPRAAGPVIWTAVGAGLTWGAALFVPEV